MVADKTIKKFKEEQSFGELATVLVLTGEVDVTKMSVREFYGFMSYLIADTNVLKRKGVYYVPKNDKISFKNRGKTITLSDDRRLDANLMGVRKKKASIIVPISFADRMVERLVEAMREEIDEDIIKQMISIARTK